MNARRLFAIACAAVAALPAVARPQATVVTYTNEATFLADTGATDNGPVPNDGIFSPAPALHSFGTLPLTFSIAAPASALHFGTNGVNWPGQDWTTLIPGHDIAISGIENLNVELPGPAYSVGFEMAELSSGPGCGGGCVNSPVALTFLLGGTPVATTLFDAPNDVRAFFGVWLDMPFDRVELRDSSGNLDDEYWGKFWVGDQPPCASTIYCTPGTSAAGCVATISALGAPSASAPLGFVVTASNVDGQRLGLIFYGVSGPSGSTWGSQSFLCVKSPTQRTNAHSSGGTSGSCDGVLALDWNAYRLGHPGALGQPFVAGDHVWLQAWYRDPASSKTTTLSNALAAQLCP